MRLLFGLGEIDFGLSAGIAEFFLVFPFFIGGPCDLRLQRPQTIPRRQNRPFKIPRFCENHNLEKLISTSFLRCVPLCTHILFKSFTFYPFTHAHIVPQMLVGFGIRNRFDG
jgi:hypothetical protein